MNIMTIEEKRKIFLEELEKAHKKMKILINLWGQVSKID